MKHEKPILKDLLGHEAEGYCGTGSTTDGCGSGTHAQNPCGSGGGASCNNGYYFGAYECSNGEGANSDCAVGNTPGGGCYNYGNWAPSSCGDGSHPAPCSYGSYPYNCSGGGSVFI